MPLTFSWQLPDLGLGFKPHRPPGPYATSAGRDGPHEVAVNFLVTPGEDAILAAEEAAVAAREEAVAAARKRIAKPLKDLANANETLAAADLEVEEATSAVREAERDHAATLAAAKPPTATRAALEAAKTRLTDANQWKMSAANRQVSVRHQVRTEAVRAWLAESTERHAAAERAIAKAAEQIRELLAEVAKFAIQASPEVTSYIADGTDEVLGE
jgi:hypothetical protein